MKAIRFSSPLIAAISALFLSAGLAQGQFIGPKAIERATPRLSQELRYESGTVWLLAYINKNGYVVGAEINYSSNNLLNDAALEAIFKWTFEPASVDGRSIESQIIQPIEFSEGTIAYTRRSKTKKDREAKPIVRQTPDLPEELESIKGYVTLKALVDPRGGVPKAELIETTHEELTEHAIRAARKWKFRPAIRKGKEVATEVVIPFHFSGKASTGIFARARFPRQLDVAPKPIERPQPSIPEHLQKERAETKLLLYIDENGYVADTKILESTNDELAGAAVEAARDWTFKPAFKDGIPVEAKIIQPFKFNGGILVSKKLINRKPRVRTSPKPELPESLQGLRGYVNVLFQLDEFGNIVHLTTRDSSHDELIEPTLEAAKNWKFRPAIKDGDDIRSLVIVPFKFGNG